MSTPSAPASWSSGTPRSLTGSAHPSCCLGAIFGRKCCHTPAHSSSNGASSGTLWTGQPQRSQLKPRRNTTCAPSPCRFSNQAPSFRVQHPRTKRWDTIAEVVERKTSGRSYGVKTESGRMLWRNRRFLRLFFPSAAEA